MANISINRYQSLPMGLQLMLNGKTEQKISLCCRKHKHDFPKGIGSTNIYIQFSVKTLKI